MRQSQKASQNFHFFKMAVKSTYGSRTLRSQNSPSIGFLQDLKKLKVVCLAKVSKEKCKCTKRDKSDKPPYSLFIGTVTYT